MPPKEPVTIYFVAGFFCQKVFYTFAKINVYNMGYLLFFVAFALSIVLYPLGFVYSLIRLVATLRFKTAVQYLNRVFFTCAILIDIMGNVFMRYMFNDFLVKPGAHPFGSEQETISKVLGINKANNKLTLAGKVLAAILNFLDKDHVEKAAQK